MSESLRVGERKKLKRGNSGKERRKALEGKMFPAKYLLYFYSTCQLYSHVRFFALGFLCLNCISNKYICLLNSLMSFKS